MGICLPIKTMKTFLFNCKFYLYKLTMQKYDFFRN